MEKKEYTKAEIFEELKDNACVVSFNKVNGDVRHMTCTLSGSEMPAEIVKKLAEATEKSNKVPNEKVMSVWDLKKAGWRSFRVENVFWVSKVLDS